MNIVVSDLTYVNVDVTWNDICLMSDLCSKEIEEYVAGEHKST